MGEIEVKTSVFPYRFSLKDKQPLELTIELKNEDSFDKMVSLDVSLPKEIGFDKSSINRSFSKKFASLKAGETIVERQLLYLSQHADLGETEAKIRIAEHYSEFGNITNSYNKSLGLRIVQ